MNCPICNTSVDSHPASRCMDVWVAKEICCLNEPPAKKMFDWERSGDGIGWIGLEPDITSDGEWSRSWTEVTWPSFYSTSIYCAWQVLEEMRKRGWWPELLSKGNNDAWVVCFTPRKASIWHEGRADTAPLAICIAALKASASQQLKGENDVLLLRKKQ